MFFFPLNVVYVYNRMDHSCILFKCQSIPIENETLAVILLYFSLRLYYDYACISSTTFGICDRIRRNDQMFAVHFSVDPFNICTERTGGAASSKEMADFKW